MSECSKSERSEKREQEERREEKSRAEKREEKRRRKRRKREEERREEEKRREEREKRRSGLNDLRKVNQGRKNVRAMIVLSRRLRVLAPRLTRRIWPWTSANAMLEKINQIWKGHNSPEAIEREQLTQRAALESLWENARETSASEYFDLIKARSADHWNLMIKGYAEMGNIALARRYFDELWIASELYRVVVTEHSYAPLFGAYVKVKNTEALQELTEHMTSRGLALGPACYSSILGSMAKQGDVVAVEMLFERMHQEGIQPTIEHVNCLLRVCAAAGEFAKMEQYAEELESKWNLRPSSGTHAIRIQAYGTSDLAKAKVIFDSLPEVERATCTDTMLGVSAQHQNQPQIDELLRESTRPPTVLSFNCILKPLSKLGNVKLCMDYFNLMNEMEVLPNVRSYNLMLSAYVHQADQGNPVDFEAMHALFSEMQELRIKPDLRTAHVLLQGFASIGQQNSIEAVLRDMRRSFEFVIDVETFDLILLTYANVCLVLDKTQLQSNITRTIALMQTEYQLQPTTKTHNIALLALGNAKHTEAMMQHLASMGATNVPTTIITHNTVIEALVKADQPERAWEHFQQVTALGLTPTDSTVRALQRLFKAVVQSPRCSPNSGSTKESRKSLTVALEVTSFLLKANQSQLTRAEVLKMLALYLQHKSPSSTSSTSSSSSSSSTASSPSSSPPFPTDNVALQGLAQKVRLSIESRPHGLGKDIFPDLRQLVFRSLRVLGSVHAKRK